MRSLLFAVAGCLTASLAAPVLAQVDSHCLPREMPIGLFPTWVRQAPSLDSKEVTPPLVQDRMAEKQIDLGQDDARSLLGLAKDDEGKPDATSVEEMCAKPKEVVELARSSMYAQAAEKGAPVLAQAKTKYADFTWDYVGNAVAWAHVQSGDLAAAARAHAGAAARIDDPAVQQYHLLAARFLNSTDKPAEQLKDYDVYRAELRKLLLETVEAFKRSAALAQKTRSVESRLRHLYDAYEKLRAVVATDAEVGESLLRGDFHAAADALLSDAAPALLESAKEAVGRLQILYGRPIRERNFGVWNQEVEALWGFVREVKRVCRMHAYLSRLGLAGGGSADMYFRQAHQMLFVPDAPDMVYQPIGHRVGDMGKDFRKRVPYAETKMSPM